MAGDKDGMHTVRDGAVADSRCSAWQPHTSSTTLQRLVLSLLGQRLAKRPTLARAWQMSSLDKSSAWMRVSAAGLSFGAWQAAMD